MPKEMLYTFIPVTLLCTGANAKIYFLRHQFAMFYPDHDVQAVMISFTFLVCDFTCDLSPIYHLPFTLPYNQLFSENADKQRLLLI